MRDLTNGKDFTGLASRAQQDVMDEMEADGIVGILTVRAARTTAAADLYWNGLQAAIEQKDWDKIDRYAQRVGWLYPSAARLWAQVREAQKEQPPKIIGDAIEAAKEATA